MSTALLVVDVQRVYTARNSELFCKGAQATISCINRLVENFQRNGEPIFLIRHVHRRDGSDLGRMFDFSGEPADDFNFKEGTDEVEYDPTLVKPAKAVEILKNRYSAFEGTDLDGKLKKAGVQRVAICGFMTNFCCESTARAAHDKDYFVDFILDATGTPGTDNLNQLQMRKVVGECLEAGFARVTTTARYVKEDR